MSITIAINKALQTQAMATAIDLILSAAESRESMGVDSYRGGIDGAAFYFRVRAIFPAKHR